MRIDKAQISGPQFMFTVTVFLQSCALLSAFVSPFALNETWMISLICGLAYIPFFLVIRALITQFPGQNIIQIVEKVYGPILGKILGLGYALFFLLLSISNFYFFGSFISISLLQETPQAVILFANILLAVYLVRHGLRVITRYTMLFSFCEFIIVLISIIFVYDQMAFERLLPLFQRPALQFLHSMFLSFTIPFGDMIIFMMLIPNVKAETNKIIKYLFWGFTMGFITLIIILFRDISVLGNSYSIFTIPNLYTFRLMEIGEFFSRMEMIFSFALIMLMFTRSTLAFYVAIVAIAQLFKVKPYRYLTLIISIFMTFFATLFYNSPLEHLRYAQFLYPFIGAFFEYFIPILTIICAKRIYQKPAKIKEESL